MTSLLKSIESVLASLPSGRQMQPNMSGDSLASLPSHHRRMVEDAARSVLDVVRDHFNKHGVRLAMCEAIERAGVDDCPDDAPWADHALASLGRSVDAAIEVALGDNV